MIKRREEVEKRRGGRVEKCRREDVKRKDEEKI